MDQNQGVDHRFVQMPVGSISLEGNLTIPADAEGIVLFVHGSGSSRNSPRNQYVAEQLQEVGLGTLLFDLLTSDEEQEDLKTRQLRFDIDLLSERTAGALTWLHNQPFTRSLNLGLFGASTGAAAALIAAVQLPELVKAVVSRGGRPDLAGTELQRVQSPTLLIVGGFDDVVISLNEEALKEMQPQPEKRLHIVPGASHLFEEPGTLEQVARLSAQFFHKHLNNHDDS